MNIHMHIYSINSNKKVTANISISYEIPYSVYISTGLYL